MYSRIYQLTHDIDWFCIINNYPIHIASNGGMLPNIYRREKLREIQSLIEQLPVICEYPRIGQSFSLFDAMQLEKYPVIENKKYKQIQPADKSKMAREMYINSFVTMAKRGFYSFDRYIPGSNFKIGDAYHLVAYPDNPLDAINVLNNKLAHILIPDFTLPLDGIVPLVRLINKHFKNV